jgi:medium-chain acyl-[acyl-carrier-protein] hydrolase
MSKSDPIVAITDHGGAEYRLILFPYGGGSPLDFRAWETLIPRNIQAEVVQYQGHGMRAGEPLMRTTQDLLDSIQDAVSDRLTAKTAFFGHSLGTLAAFEMTRRLRARGWQPCHLFLSGLAAPHLEKIDEPIHHLDDAAFDAKLLAFGGLPDMVREEPALMNFIRPIQRADFGIWETHQHRDEAPLKVPITAFAGSDDPHHPPSHASQWRAHTEGQFAFHSMSGGHFFLHDHAADIMAIIAATLND